MAVRLSKLIEEAQEHAELAVAGGEANVCRYRSCLVSDLQDDLKEHTYHQKDMDPSH